MSGILNEPVQLLPCPVCSQPAPANVVLRHKESGSIAQASATSEQLARTICLSYGRDPDELTSIMEMCTADNKPVPVWMVYEEQADAILAAYSVSPQCR